MKICKEYLDSNRNYEFVLSTEKEEGFIEIPEGMNFAYKDDMYTHFTKLEMGYRDAKLIWKRDQDEPFLTPETTLNDQYSEIEEVRQALKDNVNHPSHYTQGKVECIDALESATIGKSGIEAVCVANVIKYLWRYEDKGGLESILKAKWYLDKLIECKK